MKGHYWNIKLSQLTDLIENDMNLIECPNYDY